jgi:hypothetical protein
MDIHLLKNIAQEFNSAIARHNVTHPTTFSFRDLLNGNEVVTNPPGNRKLSGLFLDNYFPQDVLSEYHHFTTIETLESIVKSKTLWLAAVLKRFGEQEFKPFYENHGMDGYKMRTNAAGVPLEKEFAENTFYMSFTHQNLSEDDSRHLWSAFSQGNGVRLVFEFSDVKTHLRKVFYPAIAKKPVLPLLKEFLDIVRRHKHYLIIEGIATIGFFYLPGILACEQEYRLLVKRSSANLHSLEIKRHQVQGFEYVEFPLFENQLATVKLIKVIVETKNEAVVQGILNSDRMFSDVMIETIS